MENNVMVYYTIEQLVARLLVEELMRARVRALAAASIYAGIFLSAFLVQILSIVFVDEFVMIVANIPDSYSSLFDISFFVILYSSMIVFVFKSVYAIERYDEINDELACLRAMIEEDLTN